MKPHWLNPDTPFSSFFISLLSFSTTKHSKLPMNCAISLSHQTFPFPSLSSHRPNISIPSSIFKHKFIPIYHSNSRLLHLSLNHKTLTRPQFTCNAANSTGNWEQWLPRNLFAADKVLKSISGATSSPICQFISSPTTFLHSVDSRIKLVLHIHLN